MAGTAVEAERRWAPVNHLNVLIDDYLLLRRSLGFKLDKDERYLRQYCRYLEESGSEITITVESAVNWARKPDGDRRWHAARLAAIRRFASWAITFDPQIEIPPQNILPGGKSRAVPYIYTTGQIQALLEHAGQLPTPMVAATYRTLIGLLSCTGMRVGEAINANRSDLSADGLTIRQTKFGKSRIVPLHPTVHQALAEYQQIHKDTTGQRSTAALLVSTAGTRLIYQNVHFKFHRLVAEAGITARSSRCRPRIHDLRHTFAVTTLHDAYRSGADPAKVLPVLATYLGHTSPSSTYWYLQAEPGLMAEAAARIGPIDSPATEGGRS